MLHPFGLLQATTAAETFHPLILPQLFVVACQKKQLTDQ